MNARVVSWPSVVALVGLAVTGGSGCVISVDTERVTTRDEKRWTVSGVPDVSLTTFDGSIEVRSWERPEVLVVVEKQAADKELAEAIQVKIEQSGDTIRLEVVKPAVSKTLFGLKTSPSARLVATVPRRCNLTARSGDGSIEFARVDGRIDLDTGDGSVSVSEVTGSLRVHTGDGSLRLEDIVGIVDADTGDGTGRLSGRLSGVRFRTGDGSIVVRVEDGSAMAADWEIRTGDGSITVETPEDFPALLDASTGDGRVRAEGLQPPTRTEDHEDSQRALRGPLAGGGRLLRLRTGSGAIVVKRL